MNSVTSGIITIAVAIIGVATLGVILSTKSQTSSVIKSAGDAFSSVLKAAVSPVA